MPRLNVWVEPADFAYIEAKAARENCSPIQAAERAIADAVRIAKLKEAEARRAKS